MATTTLVKSQKTIALKLYTTLAADPLILESVEGIEQLSVGFEFTLAAVSTNADLDFDTLIGQNITVAIDTFTQVRYINGLVGAIVQKDTAATNDDQATYYEMKMYPTWWMLKLTQDCRLFQNKSALEIIKELLTENNILDVDDKTQFCGQATREYCVQYNESTYDFIHRLLEEEGIFYYFKHEMGRHTLILGDNSSVYTLCEGFAIAPMGQSQSGDAFLGHIKSCHVHQQAVLKSATLGDYNFTLASTNLLSKATGQGKGGEVYTYPGEPDHEDRPEKTRLESHVKLDLERGEADHHRIEGTSTIPFFLPGHRFKLKGHARADVNRDYVLSRVHHRCSMSGGIASEGGLYQNTYQAFPLMLAFRPPLITHKPRIFSTQTARVTGPQNEEIWTDKYGRIKVLFHWDRLSTGDQDSSCWVRVAKGWAGNNWGILFTPRIGMEVVVTFIEGNPDRPLVIGCVYNSDNMPPYLPEQPTKSSIKSRSSKGGEGFNEIRFEDLKGSEQIFMYAQKDRDFRVKENVTDWLEKGSFWLWVDQGNRETLLAGSAGVKKTTPENQHLPQGKGDDNLTLLSGSKTTKLLGTGVNYTTVIPDGHHYLKIDKGTQATVGGTLDTLVHIDQGKIETVIATGDRHNYIGEGVSTDYIQTGSKTLGVTNGDIHQLIDTGTLLMGVTSGKWLAAVDTGVWGGSIKTGNMLNLIETGNFKFRINKGDAQYKLYQGSHKTVLEQGDHTLNMTQGNQTITLEAGDRTVRLQAGQDKLYVNGNVSQDVTGNYTLHVTGNLTIVVGGETQIESGGNISLTTPQNISLTAGQSITLNAATSISQQAGSSFSLEAGMAMSLSSGMEMSFNALSINQIADMSYTLEAGLEASINASLSTTITSAFISLA